MLNELTTYIAKLRATLNHLNQSLSHLPSKDHELELTISALQNLLNQEPQNINPEQLNKLLQQLQLVSQATYASLYTNTTFNNKPSLDNWLSV